MYVFMYMCMYVYMYLCMYLCMCVHMYILAGELVTIHVIKSVYVGMYDCIIIINIIIINNNIIILVKFLS